MTGEHDIRGDTTPRASTTRNLTIVNRRGLHARASAKLVKLVETFHAEVSVERDGMRVPGHSIMGLMMLAAGPGSQIAVSAVGIDAEDALAAITDLVERGFDEEA